VKEAPKTGPKEMPGQSPQQETKLLPAKKRELAFMGSQRVRTGSKLTVKTRQRYKIILLIKIQ